MRSSIKDIAAEFGVNAGTVSRALNGRPGVSDELRREIIRRSQQLGYRPNGHARGLVTHRTETIGLVTGGDTTTFLSDPFYATIFAGIEAETRQRNLALMFASTAGEDTPVSINQLPKFIAERRVDGLLVVGWVDPSIVRILQDARYPFVMVDYHLPVEADTVVTNNTRGARMATEYLIGLGHRHIAFIGGDVTIGNFGERCRGYREALEAAHIPFRERLVQGGRTVGGYDSVMAVLDRDPDVTAVFACNDANALAAMRALRARGMEVPRDISIIGFDDIPAAAQAWPPLTTMRVPKAAMGEKATQRIVQKIEEPPGAAPHEIVFTPELVVRESAAAPRA